MLINLNGEKYSIKQGDWISTNNYVGLFYEQFQDEIEMKVVYSKDKGKLTNPDITRVVINKNEITHVGGVTFLEFLNNTSDQIIADKEYIKDGKIKPRFGLIPSLAIEEVANVLTYGANKYNDYNFSKGAPKTTYVDAALRHINQYNLMNDIDEESGLPHLAHAISCLMMLLDNDLNKTSIEDRNTHYKKIIYEKNIS